MGCSECIYVHVCYWNVCNTVASSLLNACCCFYVLQELTLLISHEENKAKKRKKNAGSNCVFASFLCVRSYAVDVLSLSKALC